MILVIKYVLPVIIALLIFVGIKYVNSTYKMRVIDLEKYNVLLAGKKQSLVFVTVDDCESCEKTKDLLKKMLQGSNIKTYEFNIDTLTDTEKGKFLSSIAEGDAEVTAPGLLLVKEDKLVSTFYGPFEEDLIIEYLQESGLVKQIKTTESNDTNEQ